MPRVLAILILLFFPLLVSCHRDGPKQSASQNPTVASRSAERPHDSTEPQRSGDDAAPSTGEGAEAAVSVLRDYYSAIAAPEYERAYKLWGSSGSPGQTLEQFKAGFRDTVSVNITTGEPSPIGAAAGSRYVEVPVKITAKRNDGTMPTFEGTYTMRRAVVDGATTVQRAWHIDHAAIRRAR